MIEDREKRNRLHDLWKIQFNDLYEKDPEKIHNYWKYVGQLGANGLLDDELFKEVGFLTAAKQYLQNVRQQENQPVHELFPELVEYINELDQTKFKAGDSGASGGLSTS